MSKTRRNNMSKTRRIPSGFSEATEQALKQDISRHLSQFRAERIEVEDFYEKDVLLYNGLTPYWYTQTVLVFTSGAETFFSRRAGTLIEFLREMTDYNKPCELRSTRAHHVQQKGDLK